MFIFLFENAWAVCSPTKKVLKNVSGPNHNEYLYKNTNQREQRLAGREGEAYLCGYESEYGGCPVGTRLRLTNAAIGGAENHPDSVYTCSGTAADYYWTSVTVENECVFTGVVFSNYISELDLYEVDGRYCKEVSDSPIAEIQNDMNSIHVHIDGVSDRIDDVEGNVLELRFDLMINDMIDKWQAKKLDRLARRTRKLKREVNKKTTPEDVVKILNDEIGKFEFVNQEELDAVRDYFEKENSERKKEIRELKKNNLEQNWKITNNRWRIEWVKYINELRNDIQDSKIKDFGERLAELEDETLTESEVVRIFKDEYKNAGLNEKQKGDVLKLLAPLKNEIQGLKDAVDELENRIDDVEDRQNNMASEIFLMKLEEGVRNIKQAYKDVKQDFKLYWNGREISSLKEEMQNRATYDDVERMIQDSINKSGLTQKARKQVKEMIEKVYDDMEKELEKRDQNNQQNKRDLDALKKAHEKLESQVNWGIDVLNAKIWLEIQQRKFEDWLIKNDIKNTNEKLTKLKKDFKDLADEVGEKWGEERVMDAITRALTDAELNEKQLKEVKNLISESAKEAAAEMEKIEKRLEDLEQQFQKLKTDTELLLEDVKKLYTKDGEILEKIEGIKTELAGKATPSQVAEMIANAVLNTHQEARVVELIVQYTKSLSESQREEVMAIINPLIANLTQRLTDNEKREESRGKVHESMSVLNAFKYGQEQSVWKNAEGKFNTARLASDATAGVVLGTAGGLISNKLIKKSQIKKGYEGIGCYVAGQEVAGYGDEFTVGMQ